MKIARTYYLASALCLALLSATGATAATIQLRASLNGAQEVPPNLVTPASGTGVMTFDTVTRQLTWTISYSGLQSAIGDAHFHGPTPAGFDAGIQVPIGPGASPLVGAATLTVQQAADLLAGQYYINIHSVNLPGGEIRGQVLPVRGDFNADGQADIFWRNTDGTNYVWNVNGSSISGGVLAIASQGLLPGVDNTWAVAGVGDFNGDGKLDIFWRRNDGTNYIWHVDGATINGGVLSIVSQGLLPTVDTSWTVVGIGDFNGDGKSDVLWRRNDGTNYVWHVDGTTINGGVLAISSQGLLPTVDTSWNVAGVGDFNGDGKGDILWRRSDGTNYVWHVNGASISGGVLAIATQGLLPGVPTTWSVVGVGDFSGEGLSDILWRNADGTNYVWHVNGSIITGGVLSILSQGLLPGVTDLGWGVVGVADYNGDGKADIFWRHTDGTNYVWHVDGATINGGVLVISTQGLLPGVGAGWSVAGGGTPPPATNIPRFAYVVNVHSGNISAFTINSTSGALTAVSGSPFATGTTPGGGFSIHASGKFAYVANTGSDNISGFSIDTSTGALTAVSGSPFATEFAPSGEVSIDPSGKFAYVPNYGSSNISAYTIDATSGALTAVAGSPFAAGTPFGTIKFDASGNFLYVGTGNSASSNVSVYTIDASTGALTAIAGSPFTAGSGSDPGFLIVHPSGKFLYVANLTSNNISAYTVNAISGALTPVAGSPFAAGTYPLTPAVDPSGKFAYVGNQVSSNISAYTIDATSGALTAVAGSPFATGSGPFEVSVHPSGKFAYVPIPGSNNIAAFSINASTGALAAVAGSPFAAGTLPLAVFVEPSGKFAYVTNHSSNSVSAYSINATTGAITAVAGSPFATGSGPLGVIFYGGIP